MPVNPVASASLNERARSLPMRFFVTVAAALALAFLAGTALAAPAEAPHAAACVAALKAHESDLASTLKAGAPVESELLKVVRSGIAIIGTQYLAGLREAEARQLLQAAEKDFQELPPSTAEARQAQCLEEGNALYKDASPLERTLITTAAQRRIRRLTAAPHTS
ncbi:MAG: hypothetical protein ACXWCU_01480 [Caldimonas sp.]